MEMGEIAEAFVRCVNSSGVMQYRTGKGWVSELSRGHGREFIAEILSVWNAQDKSPLALNHNDRVEKQSNCGVADICSVGASVLARLQISYCELFSSLSRELVHSFKALPVRSISFEPSTVGGYVRGLLQVLAIGIKQGFNVDTITKAIMPSLTDASSSSTKTNDAGISMYLGMQLNHLQLCLFDDKERTQESQRATSGSTILHG